MAVKVSQIKRGVAVKLNENFKVKSLSDKYCLDELIFFISDDKPYNDANGYYIYIRGGSRTNSAHVYLDEIDLFFGEENQLYSLYSEEENSNIDSLFKEIKSNDELKSKFLLLWNLINK